MNIKKQFAEKNLAVFIQTPSIEVLESRIRKRQSDSEDKIRERVNKAKWEMTFANELDRIVVNNVISVA